jgi:phage/plasmid-like protein (TIGR03299 family)
MELPENILVGGVDVVKMYLIGVMSHDGRSKNRVLISPTRVVCRSTLTAAMRDCVSSVEISHTSGVNQAMEQARRVLGVSFKAAEEFTVIADQLIDQKFSTHEFETLIDAIWEPKKDKAGRTTRTTTVRKDKLFGLRSDADTQEDGRGTKWAAFNAVAEYMDWYAPMKNENPASRATRIATGTHTVEAPKTKALTLLGV